MDPRERAGVNQVAAPVIPVYEAHSLFENVSLRFLGSLSSHRRLAALLVCVRSLELTKLRSNSLFIREITGNFLFLAVFGGQKGISNPAISGTSFKIPCKIIREIILLEQGIVGPGTGKTLSDRLFFHGRVTTASGASAPVKERRQ
jgi:hypothetical protein